MCKNRWNTLLWSPKCLCFHSFHLKGLHLFYPPFSVPVIRKALHFLSQWPYIIIKKDVNMPTLTLTLMILLWKLLSTTITSPVSALGESVPSCLKRNRNVYTKIIIVQLMCATSPSDQCFIYSFHYSVASIVISLCHRTEYFSPSIS